MELKSYIDDKVKFIDAHLERLLPPKEQYPPVIHESMHYSVFAGGKRLRPVLTVATGEMLGANQDDLIPFACAVELIHCYSLVHDDLPALDNDDLRRGKPTNHKVFGEANAILAGDALLNRAYEIMLEHGLKGNLDSGIYLRAAREISNAIGTGGMIGGQVVDLQVEGQEIEEDILLYIHNNKTGALLKACVKSGAVLAKAQESDIKRMERFAEHVGLGFQIVDDILDVTSTQEKLGKETGKDEVIEKATFPRIYGLNESRKKAEKMLQKALDELNCYDESADILRELARYLINRDY